MTAELWLAKKVVDSTLHPGMEFGRSIYALCLLTAADGMLEDTGEPIFLPFRMSCFVLSNLVVTAGMLTPGLGVRHLFLTLQRHSVDSCRQPEHYYGKLPTSLLMSPLTVPTQTNQRLCLPPQWLSLIFSLYLPPAPLHSVSTPSFHE